MSRLDELIIQMASDDDAIAEAAALELAAFGGEAVPILEKLLSSGSVDQRWWGTRALAEIEDEAAVKPLIHALRDPDESVQYGALLALHRHQDPRTLAHLLECLDSNDQLLARLAGNALAAFGGPAVTGLIDKLENGSHLAQIHAARALALIGDSRSIPVLFKALDHNSLIVQHWANEGLERMGVGMSFFKPD